MSVIYLKHERHGTKVATAETEAVADEANGWVRFEPVASDRPSMTTAEWIKAETQNIEKRKYTRKAA